MTARLVPAEPDFATPSEKHFALALRDRLPDEAVLLCNRRFRDDDGGRDLEADLVVAWPGVGVAVVEVKGGNVYRHGDGWWQSWEGGDRRVDPVGQALRCRHALHAYLRGHGGWTGGQVRTVHMAAFPAITLPDRFVAPDAHRWMLLDREDIRWAADRVRAALLRRELPGDPPDVDDVEALVTCLEGTSVSPQEALARLREREDALELLTQEQSRVLDGLVDVPRVEVRGGAGSGKTWLALEKARRLGEKGHRVALMCYSRGLASYLERHTAGWSRKQRPAYVGTFHGLAERWGVPPGSDDDSVYWERDLPRRMVALAGERSAADHFDAVVDEAQDFDESWWPAVLAVLRSPEHGSLYVFSDEKQRVFARQGRPAVDLVPFSLTENLRNTQQIAQTFGSLTPGQMRYRGGNGAPVRFVPCSPDEAVDRADEAADGLLADGWSYGDVALLTTHHRHPVQVERQARGQDAYWASFWEDDDLFYGHVLGFKGLERPAVVLAVNGFRDAARAREMLYVGLSRARDLLVVCGDLEQIRAVGGEGVARRLQRG